MLAAIWGASFLFMRIVAPALGPIATADLRMLIAGVALVAWLRLTGFDPQWRRWGLHYVRVGIINYRRCRSRSMPSPRLHIGAGEMAVLNATSPMWGAMLSAAFLGERLTRSSHRGPPSRRRRRGADCAPQRASARR